MLSIRAVLATIALLGVILSSVLNAVFLWPPAGVSAALCLLAYLMLEGWFARSGGRKLVVASIIAAIATALWSPAPVELLLRAGTQAATIIGLFSALGMLRDAAVSSPLIQRCGEMMVRQPPGRRYAVLATGSHLISLVLNFGVLPLLGSMVVRGNTAEAAGGDERVVRIRTQRMMNAILRGYATMTVWSPLSVSFAVVQVAVHGLAWWPLLGLQAILTVVLMFLGWVMDRLAFSVPAAQLTTATPTDWRPLWQLSALVGAVVVASVVIAELLSVRLVVGAMIVVPPSAVIWLVAQHHAVMPAILQFGRRLTVSMPGFREEVTMIGGAMFMGVVVVAFVPPEETARLIGALHLPPVILVVVLSWLVMALAQVGISQIVTVTVLGGALPDLARMGVPPLVVASGLMGAWALSACSTPVGAAVLSIARMANVELRVVSRQWSGPYVRYGALVLAVWLMLLLAVMDLF